MLIVQAERYISLRQTLGFKLKDLSGNLSAFARFAGDRGDTHIRVATAVDWATGAPSPRARYIRLRDVARLARFLHAEDPIHEVPPTRFMRLRAVACPTSTHRPRLCSSWKGLVGFADRTRSDVKSTRRCSG
jgi:hypothetical protein